MKGKNLGISMQQVKQPIVKDLVLIGGGHSHAIVLRMFGMKQVPGVRLTLITETSHTPYSGMLPGHVAGFYDFDESHIDLRLLANFAGAQLFIDRAIALDLENNRVLCANRPPLAFDLLSIDIGSTPAIISVPGAAEYAIAVKPVSQFLASWNQLLEQVVLERDKGDRFSTRKPLRIGIVGGGAGGVELALAMQGRLLATDLAADFVTDETDLAADFVTDETDKLSVGLKDNSSATSVTKSVAKIHLFHRGDEIMSAHNRYVRDRLQKIMSDRDIQLHLGETVCAIEKCKGNRHSSPFTLNCESGLTVECDRVFWVTQASAPKWLREAGLATDKDGFIQVSDTLQSVSHPHIFAAGDIATMINHPRPKAGVFAVRQGKPLFENLQRALLGKPLKPFRPQKQFLTLIGTGTGEAIASRGFFSFGPSPLLWRWKDWIDRRFMEKFSKLPRFC